MKPDPSAGERVKGVSFTDDTLGVDLADGRTIPVPPAWHPRLLHATPDQRAVWQPSGGGDSATGDKQKDEAVIDAEFEVI